MLQELHSFRSQPSRKELFVKSSRVSQSFLSVGLHHRRDRGFFHSPLTETGARLVSNPRRKLLHPYPRLILSRVPSSSGCSEGKLRCFSWIFKYQLPMAAEGSQ